MFAKFVRASAHHNFASHDGHTFKLNNDAFDIVFFINKSSPDNPCNDNSGILKKKFGSYITYAF